MRLSTEFRENPVKKRAPAAGKNFFGFTAWRCGSNSIEEDFVHPTHFVTSSKVKSEVLLESQSQVELRNQAIATDLKDPSQGTLVREREVLHRSEHTESGKTTPSKEKSSSTLTYQAPYESFNSQKVIPTSKTSSNIRRAAASPKTRSNARPESLQKVKAITLCCDKCDGKHETDSCPHYKMKREVHLDGQKNGWKLVGGSSNLPGAVLRMARVVHQAGDGSCLFHSMSYGIKDGSNAGSLRREICAYIQQHPQTPICETPLSDWVNWDSGVTCTEYAMKMKNGAWGGGIEMACMSALKLCNVHVYESFRLGGYKRISAFDHPVNPELKRTVRVLYRGGVHYDALMTIV